VVLKLEGCEETQRMISGRFLSHCATCPIRDDKLCKYIVPTSQSDNSGISPKVIRSIPARKAILNERAKTDDLVILCYGTAMKYSRIQDGRRVAYSVRFDGDVLNPSTVIGDLAFYSVEAITETRIAVFDKSSVSALFAINRDLLPRLSKYLNEEIAEVMSLARVLALGTADQRVVHHISMWVGLASYRQDLVLDSRLQNMRQQDIADATGLSVAHVNRVLNKLRRSQVIELINGKIRLIDRQAFAALQLI
jgi:CRP/FNR family transcriptional regulator